MSWPNLSKTEREPTGSLPFLPGNAEKWVEVLQGFLSSAAKKYTEVNYYEAPDKLQGRF
jgi:hypothetical protein